MRERAEGGTSTPSHVPSPTRAEEGTGARGKEGAKEGWLDDVLVRAKGEAERGTLTRLNVDIDEELHYRLKEHCLRNRVTLRKLVPVLLAAYLEAMGD